MRVLGQVPSRAGSQGLPESKCAVLSLARHGVPVAATRPDSAILAQKQTPVDSTSQTGLAPCRDPFTGAQLASGA